MLPSLQNQNVVHSQLVNSHTGCQCCRIITHVTVVPQSLVFSIYVLPHLHLLWCCENHNLPLHERFVYGFPILDLCRLWMNKTCTRTWRQYEQALWETLDSVLCLFWSRTGHIWTGILCAFNMCQLWAKSDNVLSCCRIQKKQQARIGLFIDKNQSHCLKAMYKGHVLLQTIFAVSSSRAFWTLEAPKPLVCSTQVFPD